MLHYTLVAETNVSCLLLEGGHVIGAWLISEGYVVKEKTQKASCGEGQRHCFQTSVFMPVRTEN